MRGPLFTCIYTESHIFLRLDSFQLPATLEPQPLSMSHIHNKSSWSLMRKSHIDLADYLLSLYLSRSGLVWYSVTL